MAQLESNATKAIDKRMDALEPGSERYEVLQTARQFKTSWLDLGGQLFSVRKKKLFEQWGFPNFESYCQDEIRIKPRTAAKLTASFAFLKQEEPAVLKRDGIKRPLPAPEAIEVLKKAHETEEVSEEEYRRIKEMALDEVPVASLRKELKQSLPEPEPKSNKQAIKQLLNQAARLADGLAAVQGIPRVIVERTLALVDDLRSLIDH
jgi:hypothetical protein